MYTLNPKPYTTLRRKYILFGYMDPWGGAFKGRRLQDVRDGLGPDLPKSLNYGIYLDPTII